MNLNLICLLKKQRKEIKNYNNYGKLTFSDIKRLDKKLNKNIFTNECVLYNGHTRNNQCIFSYNGKKISLQRLLYHNYINDISQHHVKLKCKNQTCCCINHFDIQK